MHTHTHTQLLEDSAPVMALWVGKTQFGSHILEPSLNHWVEGSCCCFLFVLSLHNLDVWSSLEPNGSHTPGFHSLFTTIVCNDNAQSGFLMPVTGHPAFQATDTWSHSFINLRFNFLLECKVDVEYNSSYCEFHHCHHWNSSATTVTRQTYCLVTI